MLVGLVYVTDSTSAVELVVSCQLVTTYVMSTVCCVVHLVFN